MKQNIDQKVSKRSHVGKKRPQDEIMSEVMAEIEQMKKVFKFSANMIQCRWDHVPHLNPPQRLNSQTLVVTLSASTVTSPAKTTLAPLAVESADTSSDTVESSLEPSSSQDATSSIS